MARKHFYGKASGNEEVVEDVAPEKDPDHSSGLQVMTGEEHSNRKRRLKEQLREQHKEKLSKQKKKRLNKYIEHQLEREERQILMKKLQETKIDTSILKSAKLIGTGKETKREQLTEALEKEKAGKGTKETHELLYEPRHVKSWEDELKEPVQAEPPKPAATVSFDFGFSNVPKAKPVRHKRKLTWREQIEAEEAAAKKAEDDDDFASDTDDSESTSGTESNNTSESNSDSDSNSNSGSDSNSVITESPIHRFNKEHSEKAEDFKAWAEQQAKKMDGVGEVVLPNVPANYKPTVRPEDVETSPEFVPLNENQHRKIFTVNVERSDDIQQVRIKLPVYGEEYRIMDAIHNDDCVIICGETGSGKTTQVPQFLFEAGYGSPGSDTPGMIGVTEPRRVAAVSMAKRVSTEMGNCGNRVGYQIRFDGNVNKNTAMKFMTDGVLLREMMSDFMLTKYSAIIIDEAHERSVNTDILIGMLSRILKLRREYYEKNPAKYKPLKLIVMSATLRVKDFSENKVLFKQVPPVLKIDARQYPVSIHFNRHTAFNYTEEIFRKTCKIHRQLPKGGILVFLTGKAEIDAMVKRLRGEFPFRNRHKVYGSSEIPEVEVSAKNVDVEAEDINFSTKTAEGDDKDDDYDANVEAEKEEGFEETLDEDQTPDDPLYVLPLYSLLPTKEQMKVFAEPPKGSRLCVVATNVAETSLTIPGIKYVVDCGRAKERCYNEDTGVQSFEVGWISKASADQRAGRAGRTGPGHCYRIYSSAIYESDFPQFSMPEIMRMPVESVVLTMKSMGIDNVVNFPFPSSPSRKMLSRAEKLLRYLGAIDDHKLITDFGRQMSLLPVSPRFSKMLLIANQHECLPYVVALVSGFSVGDPFLTEYDLGIKVNEIKKETKKNEDSDSDSDSDNNDDKGETLTQFEIERRRRVLSSFNKSRRMFGRLDKYSDSIRLLFAICCTDYVKPEKRDLFYEENFLNGKVMNDIRRLRRQLSYIVNMNMSKDSVASSHIKDSDLKLPKPTKIQVKAIKQMITAGYVDQVAIRADTANSELRVTSNTRIINIPYVSLFPSNVDGGDEEDYCYIHPSSILTRCGDVPPEYLVYQTLQLSSNANSSGVRKLRLKPLNDISGKALSNVAKRSGLITYSKPLGPPYGPKNISPTEKVCYVVPRFGANIGTGGVGWNLPAIKVKQKKVRGEWIVE